MKPNYFLIALLLQFSGWCTFASAQDTLHLTCESKKIREFCKKTDPRDFLSCIVLHRYDEETKWKKLGRKFSSLPSLKSVVFEENTLFFLPEEIIACPNLQAVHSTGNEELDLDSCISLLARIPSLRLISLEIASLDDLPDNLWQLQFVDSLVLRSSAFILSPHNPVVVHSFSIPVYRAGVVVHEVKAVYTSLTSEHEPRPMVYDREFMRADRRSELTFQPILKGSVSPSVESFEPTTVERFERKYESFSRPFSSVDVEKDFYRITDTKSENVIVYERSGTRIIIPPDAFVDASGNTVFDEVVIDYREFRDAADFIVSGIPMTFIEGDSIGYFQSAGMFEINASQNGEEVFLRPGALVDVEFMSTDSTDAYSFYDYNDTVGQWNRRGVATALRFSGAVPKSASAGIQAFITNLNQPNNRMRDTTSLQDRFLDNDYCYTRLNDASMNKHLMADDKWYKARDLVRVRGVRRTKEGTVFYLRVNNHFHPELKPFDETRFLLTDGTGSPEFKKKFGGKISYNDVRILKEGEIYQVLLKGDSTINQVEATCVKRIKQNDQWKFVDYKVNYNNYRRTLAQREKRFAKFIGKHNFFPYNWRIPISEEEKRIAAWDNARLRMSNRERRLSYPEWLAYVEKNKAESMNSEATANNMIRSLTLDGFGLYNCDIYQRLNEPVMVLATYENRSKKILSCTNTYIVDRGINGVLCFGGSDKNTPASIAFSRNGDNILIVAKPDGNVGVYSREQFAKSQFDRGKNFNFEVTEVDTTITNVGELRKILSM